MKYFISFLNWVLIILFALLALSLFANDDRIRSFIILIIILFLFKPSQKIIEKIVHKSIPWFVRLTIIFVLIVIFYFLGSANKQKSIYVSEQYKNQFMALYEKMMASWPVEYETVSVETTFGKVHVIISGAKDAPPVLLCHAGALPSWSWKYNIKGLNQHFRTFAVDAIGEVGKSVLDDINKPTKNGKDIADLYCEISNKLGIQQAHVIGASYGGFIAANYALYFPERVKKLVLIGPMGVTTATGSTLCRIVFLTLFPFSFVQDSFVDWMIEGGNDETNEIVEWMRLVFKGVRAKEAMPITFSPQQLESLNVPVLLILGRNDNLVGDPFKVKEYTKVIPDIKTAILNTSHGIWAEKPDSVNGLAVKFLTN